MRARTGPEICRRCRGAIFIGRIGRAGFLEFQHRTREQALERVEKRAARVSKKSVQDWTGQTVTTVTNYQQPPLSLSLHTQLKVLPKVLVCESCCLVCWLTCIFPPPATTSVQPSDHRRRTFFRNFSQLYRYSVKYFLVKIVHYCSLLTLLGGYLHGGGAVQVTNGICFVWGMEAPSLPSVFVIVFLPFFFFFFFHSVVFSLLLCSLVSFVILLYNRNCIAFCLFLFFQCLFLYLFAFFLSLSSILSSSFFIVILYLISIPYGFLCF